MEDLPNEAGIRFQDIGKKTDKYENILVISLAVLIILTLPFPCRERRQLETEEATDMTTIADPIIGSWYKDLENNLTFKVVNIEETDDSITVQYINGDIDEYDHDSWYNSTFDYIEDPEDWSAPFDDIETDDLGYSDTDKHNPNPEDMDIDDYLD